MSIFDFLTMIGGLCLFLFGMDIMGQSLERRAGGSLRALLEKLTSNKILGLLTGLGITAVIQSSSATKNDLTAAEAVEPLEQVIDRLKELLRSRHILRLQQGECTIEAGFIWSDILTAIERTSDHCSNIAGCVIDAKNNNMNIHESLRLAKSGSGDFDRLFKEYSDKYAV